MSGVREAGFTVTDDYVAVDKPYGGQAFSMTVVVPRNEASLASVVEDMDEPSWAILAESLRRNVEDVELYLPRFTLTWEKDLKDPLIALGMGVAFDPTAADFSRLFADHSGGWINEVLQGTYVRVDEDGTEAAAVTGVDIADSGPPEVRADRPFLFAVRERLSGTILFLGVVVEPPTD